MSVTLALVNQKGGCGKTTSAIHLAAALAVAGHRVLLVDFDPQGHATLGLGQQAPETGRVLADLLRAPGGPPPGAIAEVAMEVREGLYLVPGTLGLAGLEVELSGCGQPEQRLKRVLQESGQWDVVVIDCPPNLGFLTLNALSACDDVVIPFDCSPFAIQAVGRVGQTLETLGEMTGHRPETWYLPVMVAARDRLGRAVVEQMRARYSGQVLAPGVRRSVVFPQAAAVGRTVSEYRPRCPAAMDYPDLAQRLVDRWRRDRRFEADFSGLIRRGQELVFTHRHLPPCEVRLAGEFNDWVPDGGVRLIEGADRWEKRLTLPPGRYEYKFILRDRWMVDPVNPDRVPNSQGTLNSVIEVVPETASPSAARARPPASRPWPEAERVHRGSRRSAEQRAPMIRRHFRPSSR